MTANKKQIPNRLSREKSPYLLQHQYNPVDWYPWGEEAFRKAKAEDKPIFLGRVKKISQNPSMPSVCQ